MQMLGFVLLTLVAGLGLLTLIGLGFLGKRGVKMVHADQLTEEPIVRLLTVLGLLTSIGKLNMAGQVLAKTTAYTITGAEGSGTTFTNRGATASVTFTLPAAAARYAGHRYFFRGLADYAVVVAAATADTLVTTNDIAADSVAIATSSQIIGGKIEAFCDGTQWYANVVTIGHAQTTVTA